VLASRLVQILTENEHLGAQSISDNTSPLAELLAEALKREGQLKHDGIEFVDQIIACVLCTHSFGDSFCLFAGASTICRQRI
jgi:hypothetical protein